MISSWSNCPMKRRQGTCACSAWRRGHFIAAFQYLQGGSQEDGSRPLHLCVTSELEQEFGLQIWIILWFYFAINIELTSSRYCLILTYVCVGQNYSCGVGRKLGNPLNLYLVISFRGRTYPHRIQLTSFSLLGWKYFPASLPFFHNSLHKLGFIALYTGVFLAHCHSRLADVSPACAEQMGDCPSTQREHSQSFKALKV